MTASPRRAYAFYATNNTYAIAVIVFVHLLKRLGVPDAVDVVVLHLPLSARVLTVMRDMGIVTRQVTAPKSLHSSNYRDCLLKLRIFELTDYDRVVYMETDAIPLRRLDSLLTFPFDEPVAAPVAHWLPQPFWNSFLLVVKPSDDLAARVSRHFESAAANKHYDMDIVNAEFAGEIRTLLQEFAWLDSEWEDRRLASVFSDPDAAGTDVSLVQFTALGKPWSFSPDQVRRLRPDAHPCSISFGTPGGRLDGTR